LSTIGVRTARLVLDRGVLVRRRGRRLVDRAPWPARAWRRAACRPCAGAACACSGGRRIGGGNHGAGIGGGGGRGGFALLARGILDFLARDLFHLALAVALVERVELGLLAGLRLGQLAQHFLVLGGRRRRVGLVALHVGALLAHFHVHRGLRLAGADGELLDLAALERDLLRGGGLGGLVVLAVRPAQEPEQLHLLGAADHLLRPAEGHACASELLEQLLGGHSQHFGQRTYGDFRHCLTLPCVRRQGDRYVLQLQNFFAYSNQCWRAAMISLAACSASMPSMSMISSTASSARSSRETTPREARM
jgi:hypothetical protein